MSDGAMLQRLERADRDAELLARLDVLDGHREGLAHGADRLGRQRRDRLVDRALDDRKPALGRSEHVLRLDPDLGESDLRGAPSVLGRIAAARHARRVGVDEEEPDPVAVAPVARDPGRDDERVGAVAVDDETLLAVQHEGRAVLARGQRHVVEIEPGLPFGMGEAQAQFARRDPPDQIGPLVRIRRVLDDPAAEHDGLEIGFERQRLAELLHRDHGLDRAAAETAVLLRERRAEQAHFGVVAPEVRR